MSDETAIVPYIERRVYQIGDGDTRFTLPGERPLTGEEKYEKSSYEAMLDLRDAIVDLSIVLVDTVVPQLFIDFGFEVKFTPQSAPKPEMDQPIDPKAAARERSREDLKRKRKEMMKRKGRR